MASPPKRSLVVLGYPDIPSSGDPFHYRERTWVLFSDWGINTERTLDALVATAAGFSYRKAG